MDDSSKERIDVITLLLITLLKLLSLADIWSDSPHLCMYILEVVTEVSCS